MVLKWIKEWENDDRAECPTGVLRPPRRNPYRLWWTLPDVQWRRPRQIAYELLLSVSFSIRCLHITCLVISIHCLYITCTLLCRMKILDCKSKSILNIGFIDPDKIHIATLTNYPKETEENLLRFLTDQNFCDHILFPYNFRWGSLLCCVHSLISVIDKLLTHTYIYTCAASIGFCWTFKLIREELMPSTHYRDPWNSSKACRTCSKGNFNHSCALSVSFDDFLIYQLMKNLANHYPCRAGFGSGSSAWLPVSSLRSWPLERLR